MNVCVCACDRVTRTQLHAEHEHGYLHSNMLTIFVVMMVFVTFYYKNIDLKCTVKSLSIDYLDLQKHFNQCDLSVILKMQPTFNDLCKGT